jgi:hypothetical protein
VSTLIGRRQAVAGLISLAVERKLVTSHSALANDMAAAQDIVTLEKTVRLKVLAYPIELSADGRFVAFVRPPLGDVGIADVETGEIRYLRIPAVEHFTGISSLAWSCDGLKLAVLNARNLLVASTSDLQVLFHLNADPNYYMAGPAAFANDGNSIFVQCVAKKGTLVARIDLASSTVTPVIAEPRVGDVTAYAASGRFRRIGDVLTFGAVAVYASGTKEGKSFDRKHAPTGIILGDARYRCYFFTAAPEEKELFFIDLPDISERGIDGSGIARVPRDCALSPLNDFAVVFYTSASKLPWMDINESKDKAFEIYEIRSKQRIAAFGGYGVPETNWITSYVIHSNKPWTITIARKAINSLGQIVGMVTVWDLRTGVALQRVEIPDGPLKPMLSEDGQRLVVSMSDDRLLILKVK